jgi:F-type H+-transporting ATPase subunit a
MGLATTLLSLLQPAIVTVVATIASPPSSAVAEPAPLAAVVAGADVATAGPSESGGDAAAGSGQMSPSEMMGQVYNHLFAHPYGDQPWLTLGPVEFRFTNHHAAILVAAAIVLLAFGWLAIKRRGDPCARGPLQNALEALVTFVKNDMVYANIGEHHGRRFLPLFLSQFFCILLINLFGILPNFDFFRVLHFPTTATANFWVTGGLALTTFTAMLYGGIKEQGLGHYVVGLAPPIHLGDSAGMKAMRVAILCIMYPIEVLGLLIKPLALMIRLFANMVGGHLAMLTVYGLIYLFQSYAIGAVGVGFNVFLTFLELLVAFIQAYIFTYLSILFIGASVHPEH